MQYRIVHRKNFFIIGFCLAAISDLTLIALGAIALCMALIYIKLSESGGSGNGIGLKNVQDRIKIQFGDKYYKTCSKLYASSTRSISAYFPGVREPV